MPPQTEGFHVLKTIGSFLADGNHSNFEGTNLYPRRKNQNFDGTNWDRGGHRESFTQVH